MAKSKLGDSLKKLNTGNRNVGLKNLVPNKKAGSKLKNAVGARPNPTNDGSRTKLNGKRGPRRAALLD